MSNRNASPPQNPNPDYQDKDILVKPIMIFMVALAVLTVVVVLGLALFFRILDQQAERADAHIPPEARQRVLPPEPRLQVDEKMDLERYLENANEVLNSYAILDEEKGVVRIPIDQAMAIVAEQGWPDWAPVVPVPDLPAEDQESTEDDEGVDPL